jgi:hypothetical protein
MDCPSAPLAFARADVRPLYRVVNDVLQLDTRVQSSKPCRTMGSRVAMGKSSLPASFSAYGTGGRQTGRLGSMGVHASAGAGPSESSAAPTNATTTSAAVR